MEKRLLSEAGQSTRINNPKLASTLKNYGKGLTGTFTSNGTKVNFVFPDKKVKEYTERLSYNKFRFTDINGNVKTCFKKFITLVDYVKYLIGKYKPDEIIQKLLPHQKPIEEIIVNIRELFYKTLEMLINKQNPIPYIISTPDRYFSGSVFLIIMGTLLLLFSTLMMGPNKDIN